MECCERSKRARSDAVELRVMAEWEANERMYGELDAASKTARDRRRSEIVLELIRLRRECKQGSPDESSVAECDAKCVLGITACGETQALVKIPPSSTREERPADRAVV